MKVTTHELDIEGRKFVVQKKLHEPDRLEGIDSRVAPGRTLYSMDNGRTWHVALTEAFESARESGGLTTVGEPVTEGGEFEAWLLGLVNEITGLAPGERLILTRTTEQVVVLKESAVLAVWASTIGDVDLRMTEAR